MRYLITILLCGGIAIIVKTGAIMVEMAVNAGGSPAPPPGLSISLVHFGLWLDMALYVTFGAGITLLGIFWLTRKRSRLTAYVSVSVIAIAIALISQLGVYCAKGMTDEMVAKDVYHVWMPSGMFWALWLGTVSYVSVGVGALLLLFIWMKQKRDKSHGAPA